MFASVAQNEIVHTKAAIIDTNLVKHFLRKADGRGFKLNDANRLQLTIIYDSIASLLQLGHRNGSLYCNALLRIPLRHQGVKEILPNPLFWRKAHEFPAPYAEDVVFAIYLLDIQHIEAGVIISFASCL